jgi:hypothetical protein
MLSHGFYEKGAIMKNTKKYKIIILLSYFISIFVWNIFRFLLQLIQYAVFKLSGNYIDIFNLNHTSVAVAMIAVSIIIYCMISIWECEKK